MPFLTFKETETIFNTINEADTITIFRHVSPDGDAYGSSWGLYHFLKQQYPSKTILMASQEEGPLLHYFEEADKVSDEIIKNSLAIVCDTANRERIDGHALIAKKVIKIDHHPANDNYGDINLVTPEVSSCSEMIAHLCLSQVSHLDKKIAKYLYAGMLTDTLSFTISSVNHKTLRVASKLVESGLDIGLIQDALFQIDDNVYDYITYLRANAQETEAGLIYCYIEPDVLERFNLTVNQAKEVVNTFKEKKSARIWLLLIKEQSGLYRTTMRSRNVIINDIASQFGGGGHQFAAATKDLDYQQTRQLLDELSLRLNTQ
ncbi:MAG TPA: bifunctional oligoribonuclease/PAP phosphatase NrnA [Erysipelothrix sp.]|nr:bifunctional oligoribonuclease/PAP phosphatase NrnA [Erysipelothrix sp.]